MRIVALSGGPVGVSMLDVLAEHGHVPCAVIASHASGTRHAACPSTVAWCERHDLPWAYWSRLRGEAGPAAWLAEQQPDLLLSLSYDLILPETLLALAARAVNVHRGLAPAFRGAYSTIWALERGAAEIGVTIHQMVPSVDAGPTLARRGVAVNPDLTAAEAIPMVERLAVELLDDVIDDLVAGRLTGTPQPSGGEVFGRDLPPASLENLDGPGLARRIRARHNPPHPAPAVNLGERRFVLVERPGTARQPVDPPGRAQSAPSFLAPVQRDNGAAFTRNRPATWTSTAAAAAALVLDRLGGAVAVPELLSRPLRAALRNCGVDAVSYPLGRDLQPTPAALRAAATGGRAIVLGWPFGRPPSRAVRALAMDTARVVEDRSLALLDVDPWEGELGVLDLSRWTGSLDGAGAVGEHLEPNSWAQIELTDLAARAGARIASIEAGEPVEAERRLDDTVPRPISMIGRREALESFDPARARATMAVATAAYLEALHRWCPFTHWPPATCAHGFPIVVDDPALRSAIDAELGDAVTQPLVSLNDQGPSAARAAALLELPCHAQTGPEQVAGVIAALARAGVDHRGP
jgi:methionyl-tRNA formyltransferase